MVNIYFAAVIGRSGTSRHPDGLCSCSLRWSKLSSGKPPWVLHSRSVYYGCCRCACFDPVLCLGPCSTYSCRGTTNEIIPLRKQSANR